jgi:hypothetical protein
MTSSVVSRINGQPELGPWTGHGWNKKDADDAAAAKALIELCHVQVPSKNDMDDDAFVGDAALDLYVVLLGRRSRQSRHHIDTVRQLFLSSFTLFVMVKGPIFSAINGSRSGRSVADFGDELVDLLGQCIPEELRSKLIGRIVERGT